MPADGGAASGLLRPLRGVAQRRRTQAGVVRRLDGRFVRTRLSADPGDAADFVLALRRNPGAGDPDGGNRLSPAMDVAEAARPESAEDDDVYAGGVQRNFYQPAGGAYALLPGVEPAWYSTTVRAQPRI